MEGYKQQVRTTIDMFVHNIFDASETFPRAELYVTVSQLKRAALSTILNYVEGYARSNKGDQRHFLRIAYASLKETEYLLVFSAKRSFISEPTALALTRKADEIGAMLYTELQNIQN